MQPVDYDLNKNSPPKMVPLVPMATNQDALTAQSKLDAIIASDPSRATASSGTEPEKLELPCFVANLTIDTWMMSVKAVLLQRMPSALKLITEMPDVPVPASLEQQDNMLYAGLISALVHRHSDNKLAITCLDKIQGLSFGEGINALRYVHKRAKGDSDD